MAKPRFVPRFATPKLYDGVITKYSSAYKRALATVQPCKHICISCKKNEVPTAGKCSDCSKVP